MAAAAAVADVAEIFFDLVTLPLPDGVNRPLEPVVPSFSLVGFAFGFGIGLGLGFAVAACLDFIAD